MVRQSMLPVRIDEKIFPEPNSGCWLWTATLGKDGYPFVWWGGKNVDAHRLIYQLLVPQADIDGYDVHHKCRTILCVNPAHMNVLSRSHHLLEHPESTAKAQEVAGARQKAKDTCSHGHRYEPDNVYIRPRDGARECLICRRASLNEWRYRNGERLRGRGSGRPIGS